MVTEQELQDIFAIEVTNNHMVARISCIDQEKVENYVFTHPHIHNFLREYNIVHGIDETVVAQLVKNDTSIKSPLTIAQGTFPIHGEDGYLVYETETREQVKMSPDQQVDFRDVFNIPTVSKGEKLATIVEPIKGIDGKNVFGEKVHHQPGKIVTTRAGNNVVFKKENKSFYSTIEGQISMNDHIIEVHPVYEVNETLSMKTGNLDFVGSITIHGDVPTGYRVNAGGDVKIYGIVEAAYIDAGGSVFISEGFAGLQKGKITAKGDVHLSYVNQGNINTQGSIYVEQSIVHSVCHSAEQIICKVGSIIGGCITARKTVEAKDIGNRLSTKTNINFNFVHNDYEEQETLLKKQKQFYARLQQLTKIGDKLKQSGALNHPKIAEVLKKQSHSLVQTETELAKVNNRLHILDKKLSHIEKPKLIVRQTLFPQVIVAFGKYKRNFQAEYNYIYVTIEGNEITTHSH